MLGIEDNLSIKKKKKTHPPSPVFLLYSHITVTLRTLLPPDVWGFSSYPAIPRHQLGILESSSVLTLSTGRQSHKTVPCHSRCQAQTGGLKLPTTSFRLSYKLEVPHDSLPGSHYLLEQLTELGKHTYQFIKGCGKRSRWAAGWRDPRGKVFDSPERRCFCPRETGLHPPSRCSCVHLPGSSVTQ